MSRKRSASWPRPFVRVGAALRDGALAAAAHEIGARAERLVARAGEHDDAHAVVAARRGDRRAQALHHVERHRVAPFGPVDRDARDAVVDLVEHLASYHDRGWYSRTLAGVLVYCNRHRRGAADPAGDTRLVQAPARHRVALGRLAVPGPRHPDRARVLHAPARALARLGLRAARRVVRAHPRLLLPQPGAARDGHRHHRDRVQLPGHRAEPGNAGEDPGRVAQRDVGAADA